MTRGARRTAAVVSGATAILLAYEAYTFANGSKGDNAVVPFAVGFLMGHWLWQQRRVYQELSQS